MPLREDQELRRDLALRVLNICAEPRQILEIAARLERYVIQGWQTPEKSPILVEQHPSPKNSWKPRCRRRWTKGEDQQLGQLRQNNTGVMAIARELNRTPAGVHGRIQRVGLLQHDRDTDTPIQNSETRSPARKRTAVVLPDTADGEQVGITSVIWFLRTRDYTVVQTADGRYKLDEREVLTVEELFKRANRVRECLGRPTWAGMLVAPSYTNGPYY